MLHATGLHEFGDGAGDVLAGVAVDGVVAAESEATITWEVGASAFNNNNGVGNQRMMEGWFGLNADDIGYIEIADIPASFTGPVVINGRPSR